MMCERAPPLGTIMSLLHHGLQLAKRCIFWSQSDATDLKLIDIDIAQNIVNNWKFYVVGVCMPWNRKGPHLMVYKCLISYKQQSETKNQKWFFDLGTRRSQ